MFFLKRLLTIYNKTNYTDVLRSYNKKPSSQNKPSNRRVNQNNKQTKNSVLQHSPKQGRRKVKQDDLVPYINTEKRSCCISRCKASSNEQSNIALPKRKKVVDFIFAIKFFSKRRP